jgi:hypothetical protein
MFFRSLASKYKSASPTGRKIKEKGSLADPFSNLETC